MGRVVVFGSINRDLVIDVPAIPRPGETLIGGNLREFPGGKGANQTVAARRMGADVALVGAVGRDGFGASMRAFLAGEGIDLSALAEIAGEATGIATIHVDGNGENAIVVASGANRAVNAGMLAAAGLAAGDCLVCQFEIPLEETVAAFAMAKAAGAITLLNPAPMLPFPEALWPLCDIVVLNEVELAMATGSDFLTEEKAMEVAMHALLARPECSALTLVATLGKDGALSLGARGRHRVAGQPVRPVDTTGAGDCFVGALAAGLAERLGFADALGRANRAAAISVTRPGAAASMPYRFELG
jgi:ribokinase